MHFPLSVFAVTQGNYVRENTEMKQNLNMATYSYQLELAKKKAHLYVIFIFKHLYFKLLIWLCLLLVACDALLLCNTQRSIAQIVHVPNSSTLFSQLKIDIRVGWSHVETEWYCKSSSCTGLRVDMSLRLFQLCHKKQHIYDWEQQCSWLTDTTIQSCVCSTVAMASWKQRLSEVLQLCKYDNM